MNAESNAAPSIEPPPLVRPASSEPVGARPADNGWTGGQYSLWRMLLGVTVLAYTARAAIDTYTTVPDRVGDLETYCRWLNALRTPITFLTPQLDLIAMGALGVFVLIGTWDRIAALVLAVAFGVAQHRGTSDMRTLVPSVEMCALLFHASMPGAPYLSRKALGRTDPAGGWRFGRGHGVAIRAILTALLVRAALIRLSGSFGSPETHRSFFRFEAESGDSYLHGLGAWSGDAYFHAHRAQGILAFFLIPLTLWPRGWKLYWGVLAVHLLFPPPLWSGFDAMRFAHWILGVLLALGITFDPAWIRPRGGDGVERLFYDGECGLCQRFVRFVLAEDPAGRRFRFAPLQGEAFARSVAPERRATLPDSVVVLTADGRLLVRSNAAIHVLERLGGAWRVVGSLCGLVPRPIRDGVYDFIASVRKRLFESPKTACPLGPKHVTDRFDF